MASPIYLSIVPLRSMMDVGQRRQQPVHQLREALRIVLEGLRDGGEAAHVAEQDRHVAHFAAQHELLGRIGQLLDQGRRNVLAEGTADSAPIRLFAEIIDEQQGREGCEDRNHREGKVEQQSLLTEEIPGPGRHRRGGEQAKRKHGHRADDRRKHDENGADDGRGQDLGQVGVPWPRQEGFREYVLQNAAHGLRLPACRLPPASP